MFFSNTYAFIYACTHDLVGSENTFWGIFRRNWSRSVELWACFLQKGLHIKCNDKDFQTFKVEITEGHRRLILNIVTKIRNLKLKSITAWRGWRKSRKVVLMQEEIFLRHFTEAHSTKTSYHPPEPSTKLLQCSSNWAMKTHTLAASQFFISFFNPWREWIMK